MPDLKFIVEVSGFEPGLEPGLGSDLDAQMIEAMIAQKLDRDCSDGVVVVKEA